MSVPLAVGVVPQSLLFDRRGCSGRVFVDPLPYTFLHLRKLCWRQVEERRCRNKVDPYSGPCPWRAAPNRKIGLEVKPCLSRFNEQRNRPDNFARRSRLASCPADEARTRHILHARSAVQHTPLGFIACWVRYRVFNLTRNEDNTLTIALSGDSRRRTFEVVLIPVLSKEKAAEFIKGQEPFATDPARAPLVATRQLAEQTRELLRKSGISWAEELTGVCHLTGRGLLIDTRIRDDSERKDKSAVQARLRARSGLVAESILTFFRHEPI